MIDSTKKLRKYGYDLLINNFEPLLRTFLVDEVIIPMYGINDWIEQIPKSVQDAVSESKGKLDTDNIQKFFDEMYLWCLKEIILQKNIYKEVYKIFDENLSKESFVTIMDEINEHRRKIAHAKSNYTIYDFEILIELIKTLCRGEYSKKLFKYIERGEYKVDLEIPEAFYEESRCLNNLPIEDYDLDGGFVGRRNEIIKIKKLLYSNQDRIISITGAGGLGKTSLALKIAYSILSEEENPYSAMIWFSAKENKLTSENGIVSIESQISDYITLLRDILSVIDKNSFDIIDKKSMREENYLEFIYDLFEKKRYLLIIDNLETIIDADIIEFIKNVPRPSQILITSRKGLGEIERRYPLPDFLLSDAVKLFRIISKERNRSDLLKLSQSNIETLIKSVSSYPLLIKWSIGKVCLGMDINKAFNKIYEGNSEISEFVFNDIFNLLTVYAKKCLYSMVVFGDKGISKHLIQHLTGYESNIVDDAIEELIITSFIYPETKEEKDSIKTYFQMLLLTRGFVKHKLDKEKILQRELHTKYIELSYKIENAEKSKSEFNHTLSMFGIETDEDKIAFDHVKIAKNYIKIADYDAAKKSFETAISISPNLSYIYCEYARFSYIRGHIDDAEKYYMKACHIDDLNYRNHFAYGVFLRKQHRVEDAIKYLSKVELLNPEFLSVYNELGRSLSFYGYFEKANEKFEIALKQKGNFINYKHINITLYYQSDNYKRWAKKYFDCKDIVNGKKILLKSYEVIKQANNKGIYDEKNLLLEKSILKDIGIELTLTGNFDLGKEYLLKSIEPVFSKDKMKLISGNIAAESYIFLFEYSLKRNLEKKEVLIEYLKKAKQSSADMRINIKIDSLMNLISEKKQNKEGIIKFININKGFGVILTNYPEGSYSFILSNLNLNDKKEDIEELVGRKVIFEKLENPKNKQFAKNVLVIN